MRANERVRTGVCDKQLVAMAPLKAVAVLVGTAGVSGVVHFQQEGEGYGIPLLAIVFFSFLSCLVVTNRFSVYFLFGEKVFKRPFFLWEMYISFDFFPGILKLSTSFFALILNVNGVMDWMYHCESVIKFVDRVVVVISREIANDLGFLLLLLFGSPSSVSVWMG